MEVEKEIHTIQMKDNATSDIAFFYAVGNKEKDDTPVFVVHPALGTPGGYYHHLAEGISKEIGFHVVVAEIRGNGTSSEIPSHKTDWGYWDLIDKDVETHMEKVLEYFPKNPLFLVGHSLGGQLQGLYTSKLLLEKRTGILERIKGLIFITSASVYWKNYGISLLIVSILMKISKTILGYFPGSWFKFGGKREASTLIEDWITDAWTGKWTLKGCNLDLDDNIKNISIPSLFISFEGDPLTNGDMVEYYAKKFDPKLTTHIHLKPQDIGLDLHGVSIHFRWARSWNVLPIVKNWISNL